MLRSIVTGMLQRTIAILMFAGLCLLAVMLSATTPVSAGPFGVLVVFISAYLVFLGLISFFLYGVSGLSAKLSIGLMARRPIERMSFRKAYYYSTIIATIPVLLTALQSVGSVGLYSMLLVILFVVLGCIYISKQVV